MSNAVLFYGVKNQYGEFSNWYPASFSLDGKLWKTSEHYYMAMKTEDSDEAERIRKSKSPREAKKLGAKVKLRPNWDNIKFNIMYKACLAKFSQNEELKKLLLSTEDRPLHEDCSDPFWGGGPNFPDGMDLLGKVLIKVRETLRNENEK